MENVRIDKGMKRGPRVLTKPKALSTHIKKRNNKNGQALTVMPADLLPVDVIERYLSDERTADIAASYGIKRSRLNQWLLENAEEPWRKAQVARAITLMEDSKDELEKAADPLSLARARETLRAAQWELERLFSRLYGPKQEITLSVPEVVLDFGRKRVEKSVNDAPQLTHSSSGDELDSPE